MPRVAAPLRRFSCCACLLLPLGQALAGSLAQPDAVDLTQLDPATHRLQLLVILDDDHVDSRQTVNALYAKINRYQRYIASGRALKDAAGASLAANPALRPVVVIVAPANKLARICWAVLAGERGFSEEAIAMN